MKGGLQPVIKWSGSKRRVAQALHRLWPKDMRKEARYFEPFIGSGAMLPHRPLESAFVGDVIGPLIELWRFIQSEPERVAAYYSALWHEREARGHEVFYEARDRFNTEGNPLDFLVLSRMCVNGLIRFNTSGEFNNSLHHTRPGIHPERLASLLHQWSERLRGVHFEAQDYEQTLDGAREGDLVFLDPPYVGTRGRYRPEPFDLERFSAQLAELNQKGVLWMLTFDGSAGKRSYSEGTISPDLYRHRFQIRTGHSPFTRLMKRSLDEVSECLYLNFEPNDPSLFDEGGGQQGVC